MTNLSAFHGKQSVKDKYIKRMKDHIAADELVRGIGFESNGTAKGCAVGCTLDAYEHDRYESELGIPEWAARLEDHLHENVKENYKYKGDPLGLAFLKAIKPGADLQPIKHRIHIFIQQQNLKRINELQLDDDLRQQMTDAINAVIKLHQNALNTDTWDQSASYSADSAAELAARSAWLAARSAARSADSAADSAELAADSVAYSAADSAADSARSAADSAAYSAWSADSAAELAAYSAAELAAYSAAELAAYSAAYSAANDIIANEFLRLLEKA